MAVSWVAAALSPKFRALPRMHKPDPKLGLDGQDKRSVVSTEFEEVDQWLFGTVEQAAGLVRLLDAEAFAAGPA